AHEPHRPQSEHTPRRTRNARMLEAPSATASLIWRSVTPRHRHTYISSPPDRIFLVRPQAYSRIRMIVNNVIDSSPGLTVLFIETIIIRIKAVISMAERGPRHGPDKAVSQPGMKPRLPAQSAAASISTERGDSLMSCNDRSAEKQAAVVQPV